VEVQAHDSHSRLHNPSWNIVPGHLTSVSVQAGASAGPYLAIVHFMVGDLLLPHDGQKPRPSHHHQSYLLHLCIVETCGCCLLMLLNTWIAVSNWRDAHGLHCNRVPGTENSSSLERNEVLGSLCRVRVGKSNGKLAAVLLRRNDDETAFVTPWLQGNRMATHALSLQLLSSQVHDTSRAFQLQLLANTYTQVLSAADWHTLRFGCSNPLVARKH
jgi:hypothetical protein